MERPRQLVSVILASPGEGHGFLHAAHNTGQDAYPESSPGQALATIRRQKLYGPAHLHAVIVDVSMLGTNVRPDKVGSFVTGVKLIDPDLPIIAYSSRPGRWPLLKTLAQAGRVDEALKGRSVNPEKIMDAYSEVMDKKSSQVAHSAVA